MTYHRPESSGFLINGHEVWPRIETSGEDPSRAQTCYDLMGLDFEGTHHTYLRTFVIPVPLEHLQEDNEIKVRLLHGGTYANINILVWDMTRDAPRTQEQVRTPAVPVSGIDVSGGDLTVGVRESIAVNAVVSPPNASNRMLRWTSDNPRVAVVDANGIVTGISQGTTRIKGVTEDGGFQLSKSVTVTGIATTGVKILYGDTKAIVNGSHRLFVFVEPWHATSKEVTWSSGDPAIAKVDEHGVVTGIGPGSTTVTARTVHGGFEAAVKVSVSTLRVKEMSITAEFAVVPRGDSIEIKATWTPANASNRTAKWISSDTSIATVDATGRVTTVRAGKVKITAVAVDGNVADTTVIEVSPADARPFFVEAETFQATGGTFQGFKITENQSHTNYNQTGDWAEYKVQFREKGTYQVLLDAATPLDGAGVEVFINGTSVGSSPLPNTGNWGDMQRTIVTNGLTVPKAGNYTIRLLSIGEPNAWQWNADRLGFRKLTPTVKGRQKL